MMRIRTLVLLLVIGAVMVLALSAIAADRSAFSISLSSQLQNLGTREIATRDVDGLTITYPADEADVIELLIPAITDYRAMRRESAKAESDAILEILTAADIRELYGKRIPELLGMESLDRKTFDDSYAAAMNNLKEFARRWEQWSGDLSSLRIWNSATAAAFAKGGRTVFPEITYSATPNGGNPNFTVRPPYGDQSIGLDVIPRRTNEGTAKTLITPLHLDIPLFYAPGVSAEVLATRTGELMEKIHGTFRGSMMQLINTAQQCVTESLLQSEIKSQYITEGASATPEGTLLIRGLARYYLFLHLEYSGKLKGDDGARTLAHLFKIDLPDSDAARGELLRNLESFNPFAAEAQDVGEDPNAFFDTGFRLAAITLGKLQKDADDNGGPVFQRLQRMGRIPEGGFDSPAAFTAALEAAYPSRVQKEFLTARAELLTSIQSKIANGGSTVEPAPQPAGHEPPLPDRETQVFDGLTITHPPALREALAKLGPELAKARKQAQTRIEERINKVDAIPAVSIADETLDLIRTSGLEATRDSADLYTSQAATVSNARPALVRTIVELDAIQVWFKDDLRTLLKEGRRIPGFSYDPATDVLGFQFDSAKELSPPKQAASNHPPLILPIVLKDHSITDLKDVDAQVSMIRGADKYVLPLFESADTATSAQLGIDEEAASGDGFLTPAQTLFMSIHELVEADLVRQVIASPDRRWFCEGVANLLAIRACDHQLNGTESNAGFKVFESLYDHDALSKRALDVDLLGWPASGDESDVLKNDSELTQAHYYFATRVLLEATKGRGDVFLKTWIAKTRETPWNRTNAATIIATYDELTGDSLREIMKRTVSVRPESSDVFPRAK